jgi:hypothetical protein
MSSSPRINGRVIDCFDATRNCDRNEIAWTTERGLGGVSLTPDPHQSMNGAMDQSKDSPKGLSWASLEQRREASHSFSCKVPYGLILKRVNMTSHNMLYLGP